VVAISSGPDAYVICRIRVGRLTGTVVGTNPTTRRTVVPVKHTSTVACLALLALGSLTACGTSNSEATAVTSESAPPSATPQSLPPLSEATPSEATPSEATQSPQVLVDGFATGNQKLPIQDVEVRFRTGSSSGPVVAQASSADDGRFSLSIAPGSYAVSCAFGSTPCDVLTRAGVVDRIDVTDPTTNVVLFVRDDLVADPSSSSTSSSTSAASVSGHVEREDGSPASHVVVELKTLCDSCSQPWVESDRYGDYAIDVPAGTYNVICVVANEDYECGRVGDPDAQPIPVSVPPDGQVVDFMVCLDADFPACLRQ